MVRHSLFATNIACWIFLLVLVSGMAISLRAATTNTDLLYIGTYTEHGSQGIYVCHFDPATGGVSAPTLAAQTSQPSFLTVAPNRKFLYAINEFDQFNGQPTGAVSAFSIDAATGKLSLLNQVSSRGPGPAHVVLDQTVHYVLVANYDGGSIAVFPLLADGKIGDSTAFVQHKGFSVNHDRQEAPHAHQIVMSRDNRFALVADLGLDQLLVYPFDAAHGTLGEPHIIKIEPGAGPRHLTFSANGKFVYLVNEMGSTITVYSYAAHDGEMTSLQTISALPKGFAGKSEAAEIALHPSGKYLYVSNRGDDSLGVFAIDAKKGTLTAIETVKTGGKTPRNFAIDPSGSWLLAANQDSNNIFTFSINKDSGRLTATGRPIELNSPVMLDFVSRNAK